MGKIEIDNKKEHEMFMKIRILEGRNVRTHEFNDKTMIQKIARIIEETADIKK